LLALALPLSAQTPNLADAKQELAAKHYAQAKQLFAAYAKAHPESVDAELGVGDSELALREYQNAELTYRSVVAKQPQMWRAHKNLVIIEARLGRWEEFENFGADGRVREYISLESAEAAKEAANEGDVLRSDESDKHDEQARQEKVKDFALDWYTGAAHGAIKSYPAGEPNYETVRADVIRWLRSQVK
jgi:lipopolysaccharide biosynthesis regulator YciM